MRPAAARRRLSPVRLARSSVWALLPLVTACGGLLPATPGPAESAVAAGAAGAAADPRLENLWFEAGRRAVSKSAARISGQARARNVILFVGDGMGLSTVTAARILDGQNRGQTGEENVLAFETLPYTGLAKTYSVDAQVPDSAATMTALVTGVKTRSGAIGVDERVVGTDFESVATARVPTLFEEAETRGLATGIVTTSTVTHATPAACYAHVPVRRWEDDSRLPAAARAAGFPDIARQLLEFPFGDGIEVALGGGRRHFLPEAAADPERPERHGRRLDGRDLTAEWQRRFAGGEYVWNSEQLAALDLERTQHLLGLFEFEHMNWETDRLRDVAGEPSLAEMTRIAIELLARDPDGFILMVEAGRIDHGHHAGNARRALDDTIALSQAVEAALALTDPKTTLIVVTADHSHTLSMAGYPRRGNPILGLVEATGFLSGGQTGLAKDALGRPYTTLGYANGPGYTGASRSQPEGPHRHPHPVCSRRPPFDCGAKGIASGRPDLSEVDTRDPNYLQEATVPLRSETHAGEDVPIYAGGPRAALFSGVREQNYVYHALAEALGWTEAGRPTSPAAPVPRAR